MRRIAADETRHAALAWRIAAWAESTLDAETIARIDAARARALEALALTLATPPAKEIASAVGLPPAREALGMLARLTRELGLDAEPARAFADLPATFAPVGEARRPRSKRRC